MIEKYIFQERSGPKDIRNFDKYNRYVKWPKRTGLITVYSTGVQKCSHSDTCKTGFLSFKYNPFVNPGACSLFTSITHKIRTETSAITFFFWLMVAFLGRHRPLGTLDKTEARCLDACQVTESGFVIGYLLCRVYFRK